MNIIHRLRRHRPNLDHALAVMAEADAYCEEHGHDWVSADHRYLSWICRRCGVGK